MFTVKQHFNLLVVIPVTVAIVYDHAVHFEFDSHPTINITRGGQGFNLSFIDKMGWIYIEFFGKLNEPFNGTDDKEHIYGAFFREPQRDATIRWTYFNKHTKLTDGDVIYFWIRALRMDYTASELRYGTINVTML